MATCDFFMLSTREPFVHCSRVAFRAGQCGIWQGVKSSPFQCLWLARGKCWGIRTRFRKLSIRSSMEIPDFLPATWSKNPDNKPVGPRLDFTAEEVCIRQLDALQNNDHPYPDHGVEVMYRFAGFDPFQRSTYFGPIFDLGQFERFRRIFHHSTYQVLLGHNERKILSSLHMSEHCFKQRVWVRGARPGEQETFELTLAQRVGGSWDGYWLTDSFHHDGVNGISGGIAY